MLGPDPWNANEWFLLIALAVASAAALCLPKRFPHAVTLVILMFCLYVPKVLDTMIGTQPFDLYDINDSPKYEVFDLISWFTFAPFGYLYLYVYDRLQLRGYSTLLYILFCSLIGTVVEGLSMLAGVYTYKGWQLAYSFPVYLIVQSSYLVLFLLCKRWFWSESERQKVV